MTGFSVCAAVLILILHMTNANISNNCLRCICEVESGCGAVGCAQDSGSLSCGYFQIKAPYYQDCGSPGARLAVCADDKTCAENCVRNYMARYGSHCKSCECYARIHNGGPRGDHYLSTLNYWNRVHARGC